MIWNIIFAICAFKLISGYTTEGNRLLVGSGIELYKSLETTIDKLPYGKGEPPCLLVKSFVQKNLVDELFKIISSKNSSKKNK